MRFERMFCDELAKKTERKFIIGKKIYSKILKNVLRIRYQ